MFAMPLQDQCTIHRPPAWICREFQSSRLRAGWADQKKSCDFLHFCCNILKQSPFMYLLPKAVMVMMRLGFRLGQRITAGPT
jgi:hypothetical protein